MDRTFDTEHFRFKDYRNLTKNEIEEIYRLRNLIEIRKWMTHSDIIEFESHVKFLSSLSEKENQIYYLVYNMQNEIVASVNIHITDNKDAERGIFLNPKFFGKSLASQILSEFYSAIHKILGIQRIFTKVFKDNVSSNKLELKLGASLIKTDSKYNMYILSI